MNMVYKTLPVSAVKRIMPSKGRLIPYKSYFVLGLYSPFQAPATHSVIAVFNHTKLWAQSSLNGPRIKTPISYHSKQTYSYFSILMDRAAGWQKMGGLDVNWRRVHTSLACVSISTVRHQISSYIETFVWGIRSTMRHQIGPYKETASCVLGINTVKHQMSPYIEKSCVWYISSGNDFLGMIMFHYEWHVSKIPLL